MLLKAFFKKSNLFPVQVKLSAMTVNGTGPPTQWLSGRTFDADLDESVVPPAPSSLTARAGATAIELRWSPPGDSGAGVLVRGYTVGWGKGIPVSLSRMSSSWYFIYCICTSMIYLLLLVVNI